MSSENKMLKKEIADLKHKLDDLQFKANSINNQYLFNLGI